MEKIVEQCIGCNRVSTDGTCISYRNPANWQRMGYCPMASHVEHYVKTSQEKKRIGQQKQKKKKK